MLLQSLGTYVGIPKHIEVLVLTLLGICCTILDESLLNLNSNLVRVWTFTLDPLKLPIAVHLYIRYILSGVVVVRAFTVHLYLASYVILLYPTCFMEKPQLMLPWLLIGAMKTIIITGLTFFTGLYTCFMYRFMKASCWDFLFTQVITHGPSFYMWFLVLSYYKDLKKLCKITALVNKPLSIADISARRRRAKCLKHLVASSEDENLFDVEDDRHLLSASTIENMVQYLGRDSKTHYGGSRSLDTLITRMEEEADRRMIYKCGAPGPPSDNVAVGSLSRLSPTGSYTSRVMDEEQPYDFKLADDPRLTIQERTVQLLNVTPLDIIQARRERRQAYSGQPVSHLHRPLIPIRSLMENVVTFANKANSAHIKSAITIEGSAYLSDTTTPNTSEKEIRVVQLDTNSLDETAAATSNTKEAATVTVQKTDNGTTQTNALNRTVKSAPPIAMKSQKDKQSQGSVTKKVQSVEDMEQRRKKLIVHPVDTKVKNLLENNNRDGIVSSKAKFYKSDGYTQAYLRKIAAERSDIRKDQGRV